MIKFLPLTTACFVASLLALNISAGAAMSLKAPRVGEDKSIEEMLTALKETTPEQRKAVLDQFEKALGELIKKEVLAGTAAKPELLKITISDPESKQSESAVIAPLGVEASKKLFAMMKKTEKEDPILKQRNTEGEQGTAFCMEFDSAAFKEAISKTGVSQEVANDVRKLASLGAAGLGIDISKNDNSCAAKTGI